MKVVEIAGHRCLLVEDEDGLIATVRDATDLIGDAMGEEAPVVAVAAGRLDPSFFELRTGFAGEVLQKAANYGIRFAVLGDVSEHTGASKAFHDLVVESRHSSGYFFVHDLGELETRLAALSV